MSTAARAGARAWAIARLDDGRLRCEHCGARWGVGGCWVLVAPLGEGSPVGGGGHSMAEKCEVPARRSHFRCKFSPVAEGASSSW